MSLEVDLRHRLPSLELQARFQGAGRLTALFGPSGCGKTTVVNIIAGLVRPATARIVCDGVVMADSAQHVWLPPHQRQIGYVFQDARLLPHLTVRQNLNYGKWFTPKSQRYSGEAGIVDLLGLSGLLDRKPRQLSGGEKQRVAIGRALLQSPRLLLMDEPLASLDEARKQEILPYIERLRDETQVPVVYVSHSIEEVTRLATDLVLMAKGRVLKHGPISDVLPLLAEAGDEFAREAGSVIEVAVLRYDPDDDLTTLDSGLGPLRLAGSVGHAGSRFRLHVRATDVTLAATRPDGLSALNVIQGVIEKITDHGGPSVTVTVVCGEDKLQARITRFSARSLGLAPGGRVYAIIKAMAVRPPAEK